MSWSLYYKFTDSEDPTVQGPTKLIKTRKWAVRLIWSIAAVPSYVVTSQFLRNAFLGCFALPLVLLARVVLHDTAGTRGDVIWPKELLLVSTSSIPVHIAPLLTCWVLGLALPTSRVRLPVAFTIWNIGKLKKVDNGLKIYLIQPRSSSSIHHLPRWSWCRLSWSPG